MKMVFVKNVQLLLRKKFDIPTIIGNVLDIIKEKIGTVFVPIFYL